MFRPTDNGLPQNLKLPNPFLLLNLKNRADASAPCLWWFIATCTVSALTAPLLLTDLPSLGDYLNHLARMYVITQIDTDPVLARMYEVQWGVVPNLAMDLLVPALSKIMPLTVAGRVFIALSMLLPIVGVVVLHRVSFRTREMWPLSAVAVAYNGLLFWGFLNFVAGIGVALVAVALWLRERDRSDRLHLVAAVFVGLVLFIFHLEALALFGLTVVCIELCWLVASWRDRRLTVMIAMNRSLRLMSVFIIPILLFLLAAPLGERVTHTPLLLQIKEYYWAVYNSWGISKLMRLGLVSATYSPLLDGLVVSAVVLLYFMQIRRRGCRVNLGLLAAAGVLLLAYPFVPSVWMTAANIDCRLPVFAGFLVLAGVAPNGPVAPPMRVVVGFIAVLLGVRTGLVGHAWLQGSEAIGEFRKVTRSIQPGEKVLVVWHRGGAGGADRSYRQLIYNFQPYDSFAPLLTIDRRAFWPTLFTSRTLQPVHVLPPYRSIAVEQAMGPPDTALTVPTERDLGLNPYMADWRTNFDYVLLGGASELTPQQGLVPGILKQLEGSEHWALFAIQK
jgi:hypothetical protein